MILFHVNVTTGPLRLRHASALNLSRSEVETILVPWRDGRAVTVSGKGFEPGRSRLTVYEGPRLSTAQRQLGQGWLNATRFGEDVTDQILRSPLTPRRSRQRLTPHSCPGRRASLRILRS